MAAAPSRDLARLCRREHAVDEFAGLDREASFRHASRSGASDAYMDVWWGMVSEVEHDDDPVVETRYSWHRESLGGQPEARRTPDGLSGRCVEAITPVSEIVRKEDYEPKEGSYNEPVEDPAGHSPGEVPVVRKDELWRRRDRADYQRNNPRHWRCPFSLDPFCKRHEDDTHQRDSPGDQDETSDKRGGDENAAGELDREARSDRQHLERR